MTKKKYFGLTLLMLILAFGIAMYEIRNEFLYFLVGELVLFLLLIKYVIYRLDNPTPDTDDQKDDEDRDIDKDLL